MGQYSQSSLVSLWACWALGAVGAGIMWHSLVLIPKMSNKKFKNLVTLKFRELIPADVGASLMSRGLGPALAEFDSSKFT